MNSDPYGDAIAANIRALRARADLSGQRLAARMRSLGFTEWRHQTVGNIERGKRRVTAEEILGLAYALEASVAALLCPAADDRIILRSGSAIGGESVISSVRGRNDGAVRWEDDEAVYGHARWLEGDLASSEMWTQLMTGNPQ